MSSIENNVIRSFEFVRKDVMNLQSQIDALSEAQDKILDLVRQLRLYETELQARISRLELASREQKPEKQASPDKPTEVRVVKVSQKRTPKHYLGTKDGKLFHIESCPFAQNIKPKNRVKFKSKVKALNQGLKPCRCVKG